MSSRERGNFAYVYSPAFGVALGCTDLTRRQAILRKKLTAFFQSRIVLEMWLASAAMGFIFLICYGRFLRGDKSIATFPDNTYFYLPLFRHISEVFSRGEYPYWISTLMGGFPLYDNPNFSVLYPFYFFQWGLYRDPSAAILQLHYVVFFHIFISYLNCYVLCRVLRLRPLPALLGASLFAFSQNTIHYATWVALIAPYSWLPLTLAGTVLILENRRAHLGVWITAISLALIVLACPAQALIHAAWLMGVFFVFRAALLLWRRQPRELITASKNLLKAVVFAAGLGSPVLIPVVLHMGGMIRFASDDPAVIGFARLTYAATLYGQLDVSHLAGGLLPYAVRSTIGHPYVGLGAVAFALFAVCRARTNWIVIPLMLLSAYGLLSSTGSHLGLAKINYLLPLLNKFREPDRHLYVFVLGVSVLAGIGFDYVVGVASGRCGPVFSRKHLAILPLLIAVAVAPFSVSLPYLGALPKLLLVFLPAVALLLLLTSRFVAKGWHMLPQCMAAGALIAVTLLHPAPVPELRSGDFFSSQNLASRQALEELVKLNDARNYRVLFDDREFGQQRWAMNASYYDLRSFYAYFNTLPYAQFLEVYLGQIKPSRYSLLWGAKYYLCSRCEGPPLPDYNYRKEISGYKLYAADNASPRYWLAIRVAGTYQSWDDFYNKINQDSGQGVVYLAPTEAANVEQWLGPSSQPAPQQRIVELDSTSNRVRLMVETDRRAVLLFNEYYNTAWHVTVNGARANPLKVNWNQIGVLLDRGTSVVEFKYYPTLYIVLLWFQRALILGLAAYASFRYSRWISAQSAAPSGAALKERSVEA